MLLVCRVLLLLITWALSSCFCCGGIVGCCCSGVDEGWIDEEDSPSVVVCFCGGCMRGRFCLQKIYKVYGEEIHVSAWMEWIKRTFLLFLFFWKCEEGWVLVTLVSQLEHALPCSLGRFQFLFCNEPCQHCSFRCKAPFPHRSFLRKIGFDISTSEEPTQQFVEVRSLAYDYSRLLPAASWLLRGYLTLLCASPNASSSYWNARSQSRAAWELCKDDVIQTISEDQTAEDQTELFTWDMLLVSKKWHERIRRNLTLGTLIGAFVWAFFSFH